MPTATHCYYSGQHITVQEALRLKAAAGTLPPQFLCIECMCGVIPHSSKADSAHFEHLKRNPDCSLSVAGRDIIPWSEAELRVVIQAYLIMLNAFLSGGNPVKTKHYRALAQQVRRTESSIEYRMQNISYVLSLLGRSWIPGLVPAKNVGARVSTMIEKIIAELEGTKRVPIAAFEIEVEKNYARNLTIPPKGITAPEATVYEVSVYPRDPKVKAWVLRRAKGKCELCLMLAPFTSTKGEPFLEVHHVRKLAEHGSDTATNAVALCPNCHRRLHYGGGVHQLVAKLFKNVSELLQE